MPQGLNGGFHSNGMVFHLNLGLNPAGLVFQLSLSQIPSTAFCLLPMKSVSSVSERGGVDKVRGN